MQFALCLPGFEQATQPFAIVADQGLGHALRESLARSLQLPEQHSRHTGMIRHEIDMRHEDRLKGSGRRCGFFRCLVHAGEQALVTPGHYRLQESVLAREVTKRFEESWVGKECSR